MSLESYPATPAAGVAIPVADAANPVAGAATAVIAPTGPAPTSQAAPFVDRRAGGQDGAPGRERRQFSNSYEELSDDAAELARAIDAYKLRNRRRFISYEEMLAVVKQLGYAR